MNQAALTAAAQALCDVGEAATLQWFLGNYAGFKRQPVLEATQAWCLPGNAPSMSTTDVVVRATASVQAGDSTTQAWATAMQQANLPAELSVEDAKEALAPFGDDADRVSAADIVEFIQQHASIDFEHVLHQALATDVPLAALLSHDANTDTTQGT